VKILQKNLGCNFFDSHCRFSCVVFYAAAPYKRRQSHFVLGRPSGCPSVRSLCVHPLNHQWAFDWHHELWPWMTLSCPGSVSLKLQSNISKTVKIQRLTGLFETTSHQLLESWNVINVRNFSELRHIRHLIVIYPHDLEWPQVGHQRTV